MEHAKALEALLDGKEHSYTASLVKLVKFGPASQANVVRSLPDDWPAWCYPDYSQTAQEIKADPRWEAWVKKTQA